MNQQGSSSRHSVDILVQYPEAPSRGLALLGGLFWIKALLLLPHFIVMWFLTMIAFFVMIVGYWAVVFTGVYPRSLFDFGVGVQRWQVRMNAWLYSWTDQYPPFSLE